MDESISSILALSYLRISISHEKDEEEFTEICEREQKSLKERK